MVLLALTDGSGRDDLIVNTAETLAHSGSHTAFIGPGAGEGHLGMDRCSTMALMLKSCIAGQLLALSAAIRMGRNFETHPREQAVFHCVRPDRSLSTGTRL